MRSSILVLLLVSLFAACKKNSKLTYEVEKRIIESNKVNTLKNPSTAHSSLPRLFSNGKELYFSWVTENDTLATLFYSIYKNEKWSTPFKVSSGSDWFVNWADFPTITENKDIILTNLLQKSADGKYTYDVKLNISKKSSGLLKKSFVLHTDGTQSEHGFVSMVPVANGNFSVTWLDGRNTNGGHGKGSMTLRNATVSSSGTILTSTELDNRVCDCCNTAMALTQNGPIVAYRDRSDQEIRDISVVRLVNNQWTIPKTIGNDNWKINGCPVNGPAISSLGNAVALSWFTAVSGSGDVKISFSDDNGETFGIPILIENGNAIGRVDVTLLNSTTAVVSWMEPEGANAAIKLVKVSSDGKIGLPQLVAKTQIERASGFPQLEKVGDTLYLAHTIVNGGVKSIRISKLAIEDL